MVAHPGYYIPTNTIEEARCFLFIECKAVSVSNELFTTVRGAPNGDSCPPQELQKKKAKLLLHPAFNTAAGCAAQLTVFESARRSVRTAAFGSDSVM